MTRRTSLSALLLVVTGLAASTGCGDSASTPTTNNGPTGSAAIQELSVLLKSLADAKKKPPAKAADLAPYEAEYLTATLGIQQGRIVYAWGSGLTGGGTVIAYDAKAATDGGSVLLQDGTVKQMTAAEFAAAPKPATKK